MTSIHPNELINDQTLILVPHMDDEILGCGHLLAGLTDPSRVHLLFATRGDSLPAGIQPNGMEASPSAIAAARKEESLAGIKLMGMGHEHATFLDLKDGTLHLHETLIYQKTIELMEEQSINILIAPFEFDQHLDHLALNRVARRLQKERKDLKLLEYFVYINYPLLPGKDIRTYCHPDTLKSIQPISNKKREALRCHITQTTNYFQGQTRPVLTDEFCDQAATGPEVYRDAAQAATLPAPMKIPRVIIQSAQALQPRLKKVKETLRQTLKK